MRPVLPLPAAGRSLLTRLRARRYAVPPAAPLHALRLALAACLAFGLAVSLTGQPAPLFAPWTALYAVYPTVARSGWSALQRLAALGTGAGIALTLVEFSGRSPAVVGVVVFVSVLVGRWRRLGEHGLLVAGVATLVPVVSGAHPFAYVTDLAVQTAVGLGSALAVNLLMRAPDRARRAGTAGAGRAVRAGPRRRVEQRSPLVPGERRARLRRAAAS